MVDELRALFCADPTNPRRPDPFYEAEFDAARDVSLECNLIDFEALVERRDPARAVRGVPSATQPAIGIYRGWMLRPDRYAALHAALDARSVQLINDPRAYSLCHHLPNWYPALEQWTPRSTWLKLEGDVTPKHVATALQSFSGAPVIVKDFVKSQKYHWYEACFIPSSADLPAAERVVRRFIDLQGPDLNEGLVFREFEEFAPLASHSRSGMPLTREYRMFFLDGVPILSAEYWDEGDYTGSAPPLDEIRVVASRIPSRFFTVDVALRTDGSWRIVESGDAQVAGLPDSADRLTFYESLRHGLHGR